MREKDGSPSGRTRRCDECGGTGRLPVAVRPRVRKFERVHLACTGVGPFGPRSARVGLLVRHGDFSGFDLWECEHWHKTDGAAFGCARREARRRGWDIVPMGEAVAS